ncbi:UBX domain protein Ubx2 [Xanthoria parietina]
MDDGALAQFTSITGTKPEIAQRYLAFTDGDLQQAIELFFANDGADLDIPSASNPPASSRPPPVPPPATRPPQAQHAVQIDSDSDPDYDDHSNTRRPGSTARQSARADQGMPSHTPSSSTPTTYSAGGGVNDDEAFARQLQQEMYGEAGVGPAMDPEGVRAPIARTTETLIGPDSFDANDPGDMNAAVLEQLRARQRPRPRDRPGIFNQSTTESIWNEDRSSSADSRDRLARATAGASEASSKSRTLAEMYRPPYELMSRLPWDEARQQGKDGEKWILVNIQDPSIFDCQILNRDIWKDPSVMETVRENFIFMQYGKDDPRGNQYVQYYFQTRDNSNAYPHIAIVDPRTGEQVKVWSGPPAPKAHDFLMQLHEFLDRYSLKVSAKNPVAKRRAEPKKETQIEKMTEEQMLEMALQNSLAGASTFREDDPDDLTRSVNKEHPSRGETVEGNAVMEDATEHPQANGTRLAASPFAAISSSAPHMEPAADVPSTRIQFRHPTGRVVRRFALAEPVRRIYEWLKASPLEGKEGVEFELIFMQKNLLSALEESIEQAGLKNATVMVEFLEV